MKILSLGLAAALMVAVASFSAKAEPTITADQLVAHGPWAMKACDSYGECYSAELQFTKNLSGALFVGYRPEGYDGVRLTQNLVFDGNEIAFERVDAQGCGDRVISYEMELEEKGGKLYFEGDIRGPRSRCRGGTFTEEMTLTPQTPVQLAGG